MGWPLGMAAGIALVRLCHTYDNNKQDLAFVSQLAEPQDFARGD
jgi:hypothetical protein